MRPIASMREMGKPRSRRLIELFGVLIFAYTIKWLMHPINEYETLKRRRDNVHRLPDILYVEGRSVLLNGFEYLLSKICANMFIIMI
jgi:hypothetical protein